MFLHANLGFYRWNPAAWVRVSGEDALIFLQGQFTNDLRKWVAGTAVYGLWLNQKGKVVADSFVLPAEDAKAYWVGSYFSSGQTIRERLEAYIIADDVVLEDHTAAWAGITLFDGVDPVSLQEAVPGSFAFPGRREQDPHCEWMFPTGVWPQVQSMLAGSQELTEGEVMLRRIRAGVPAVPVDIGPGELPNEGGLDVGAISYTKGCYLGQEVMARLKSMGQVRRRLMRVDGTGPLPALPAALYQGERKIGELRSATPSGPGFAGLALVTLMNLQPEAGLGLAPNGPAVIALSEPA